MRYAIIENNIVTNVIECEPEFAAEGFPDAIQSDIAAIGDIYDEGIFTKQQPVRIVPERVSPRQMRLAMLQLEILDLVETTLENPAFKAQKLAWEYATSVERNDPMLADVAPMLGLSQEQIDDLFIMAEGL